MSSRARGSRAAASADALARSEARFRALVQYSSDVITVLAADGTVLYNTPAVAPVLGYTPEELTGRRVFELVHPDDLATVLARFGEALQQPGVAVPVTFRFRHGDGHWVPLESIGSSQLDDPNVRGVVVNSRDLTERRRAEDTLRKSRELYQLLIEQVPVGILFTDVDGQVTNANPAVLHILGSPSEEATRQFNVLRLEQLVRAGISDAFARALSRHETERLEVTYRSVWGKESDLRLVIVPLFDHPGRLLGTVTIVEDVTARARADREKDEEAAISAALAQVGREIISTLGTPVLLDRLCEIAARVLHCDRSHIVLHDARQHGYRIMAGFGDPPDALALSRTLLLPDPIGAEVLARLGAEDVTQLDRQRDTIARTITDQFGISAALYLALRRGDQIIGVQSAEYRGGTSAFTPQQVRIARGIAQLASLALEDARLVDELERANRLKSEFVATMSHELRTPLHIILGYLSLLLDGTFGALLPDQHDAVARADRSAHALLELISATLDLSRLESGQVPLNLHQFHLHELLGELEAETRELQRKPGVRVEWHAVPSLPPLHSDPAKLKVVLKNLLANAIKFTDAGTIAIRAEARSDGIEIAVRDTGIGIASELLTEIFEPFRQATAPDRAHSGGVGLGLYIVRRLLGELGGSVAVESTPGAGSTFRVCLPLRWDRENIER